MRRTRRDPTCCRRGPGTPQPCHRAERPAVGRGRPGVHRFVIAVEIFGGEEGRRARPAGREDLSARAWPARARSLESRRTLGATRTQRLSFRPGASAPGRRRAFVNMLIARIVADDERDMGEACQFLPRASTTDDRRTRPSPLRSQNDLITIRSVERTGVEPLRKLRVPVGARAATGRRGNRWLRWMKSRWPASGGTVFLAFVVRLSTGIERPAPLRLERNDACPGKDDECRRLQFRQQRRDFDPARLDPAGGKSGEELSFCFR